MQDEDESQAGIISTEINLDAIEEVLGDDTILVDEDDEDVLVKVSDYDEDEDDDIDIAFQANDEGYW